MDIKHHIRAAQSKNINNLIACESLIGELYEEFSLGDKDLASFWQELSLEEKDHAVQLKSLLPLLDKGAIFREIGRFDVKSVTPMMELVNGELMAARQKPPAPAHALSVALKIETNLIDSRFYDIVKSDSPEFQAIALRLGPDTLKHVDKVRKKFLSYHGTPH